MAEKILGIEPNYNAIYQTFLRDAKLFAKDLLKIVKLSPEAARTLAADPVVLAEHQRDEYNRVHRFVHAVAMIVSAMHTPEQVEEVREFLSDAVKEISNEGRIRDAFIEWPIGHRVCVFENGAEEGKEGTIRNVMARVDDNERLEVWIEVAFSDGTRKTFGTEDLEYLGEGK